MVALLVLFILWWLLLGKLEQVMQSAEQQSLNMVLTQLRSALVVKGAEAMLSRKQNLADLAGENPFEWLNHQWPMYQGQCNGDAPERGHWCFAIRLQNETDETGNGWLMYSVKQPITIDGKVVEPDQPLAWEVTTEFADRNRNNLREQDERLTGLRLTAVPLAEITANRQDSKR